jgi:hypothetical protein
MAIVLSQLTNFASPKPVQAAGVPPLLVVVDATTSPLGAYLEEILNAEGLNDYEVRPLADLSSALLAGRRAVLLGEAAPSASQVAALDSFVSGGGGLVAMRPAASLGGTLGVTMQGGTTSEAYMRITDATLGAGLYSNTMQFHGTANHYALAGASQVAQLFSGRTTATSWPAVTIANRGTGKAAMFSYDLARSVALTRQGNPANANVDTDGDGVIRTIDIYRNWADLERTSVPQADIQQRLLVRLVETVMAQPVPRLWYFPDGAPTVVVATADGHANPVSYYQSEIDALRQIGATATFYVAGSLPASTVQSWRALGFDFAPHPYVDCGYDCGFDSAFAAFQSSYGFAPRTVRTHQVRWYGWTDAAAIGADHGVGLDFNTYQWGPWLTTASGAPALGYLNGSGQPMRYIDSTGAILPIYQQHTLLVDEELAPNAGNRGLTLSQAVAASQQVIDASIDGYYTPITTQYHVDYFYPSNSTWAIQSTQYAMQRGAISITADTWLNFIEKRAATTVTDSTWSGNELSFVVGAGGTGQRMLVPFQHGSGSLNSVTVGGVPVSYTMMTVNGVTFAAVNVQSGTYRATYTADSTPPAVSGTVPAAGATGVPTSTPISATFSEVMNRSATQAAFSLVPSVSGAFTWNGAGTTMTFTPTAPLAASTSYTANVSTEATDLAGNPLQGAATWSFTTAAVTPPPSVTGVSPVSGPIAGGTSVTITGSGFTGATAVAFGGAAASSFTVNSATSITATSPPHAAGTVDITVTTPFGTSAITAADRFTYVDQAGTLSLAAINPATGATTANGTVTITGANFQTGATVAFDGVAASSVTVVNTTTLTAVVPPHAAGTVDVVVTNPGAQSATLGSGYTYVACPSGCLTQSTDAEFAAGSPGTGVAITQTADGEAQLAPAAGTEFSGAVLPVGWTASPWSAGGGATVGGGSATIDGALLATGTYFGAGRALEFVATFNGSAPFQHIGLGTDLNSAPWAIFSTGFLGGTLYARTNSGGGQIDTPIAGNWLGAPHRYRIEWTTTSVIYSIDGTQVAAHNLTLSGNLRPILSDASPGSGNLRADWLRLSPYASSGTFTSRVFDSGGAATWGTVAWSDEVPSGTSLVLSVRTGNTPTPDESWTTFASVAKGATLGNTGRYLQYHAVLGTNTADRTPALRDLVIGFAISGTPAPTVTGIAPSSGPTAGGTVVTISGTNFASGATVQFGGVAATNVTVSGTTSLTVTTPPQAAGPVDVVVTNPDGRNGTLPGGFAYIAAPPVVTDVTPRTGSTAGGNSVTITGTGFAGASAVAFGGTPVTSFTVQSDTVISAVAPARAAGVVNVTVTTPAGTSPSGTANEYTYQPTAPAPLVSRVTPGTGSTAGGTTVVLQGANFVNVTAVTFGGVATSFTVNSPTSLTATSPAHATGVVDVRVTTASGASATGTAARFVYVACPSGCAAQTAAAELAGGGGAGSYVAQAADGEVTLAPTFGAEFGGGALPSGLTATPWATGGSATVGGGTLSVDGTLVATTGYHTASHALEFVATFANAPSQHIGLGTDLNGPPWAIFSTAGGGALYARSSGAGGQFDTLVPGDWLGAPHRFRIVWTASLATYFIDGVQVASHAIGATGSMRPVISDGPVGGSTLSVDRLILDPYAASGNFTSSVLDAGGVATWGNVAWTAEVPAGTSLAVSVRAGNTPAPDGSWSAFAPVTNGGTSGVAGRYAQYQVALTTSDPAQSPAFADLTIGYTFTGTTAPTITGLSPASGPLAGGTSVAIAGSGFAGATAVAFGGTAAASFTVTSDTSITAVAPARAAGVVDVTVTAPGGNSPATAASKYTYQAPAPAVTGLSPSSGPMAGGTSVTVSGSGFAGATAVAFGGTPAASFTVTSDTTITAVAPARAAGVVHVTVTTPAGTSSTSAASEYAYVPPAPSVSQILVGTGPATGGTLLTIGGANLAGATAVTFGGTAASFTVVSNTTITATTPAHSAGTVDVRVTTPGGTSSAQAAARFVYVACPSGCAAQTAAAELAGGGGAGSYVAQAADGEVTLAPAFGAEFGGGALPTGLTAAPWAAGGAATVGGGTLTVDGTLVAATTYQTPGRVLEFVATFDPTAPYQHAGLGIDLNNTPWAIFSTGAGGGTLYARTIVNGSWFDTPIPGNWLGAPHRYRIEWTTTGVRYFIDGTQVVDHPHGNTGDLRIVISDGAPGGGTLSVDWLRLSPYAATGTYTSTILDAGSRADWQTIAWTAEVPAGTSLAVSVRAGNTPAPDGSWSAFAAVTNGGTSGVAGRYAQYQVALTTSDPAQSPALHDITLGYALSTAAQPTIASLNPANGPETGGTTVTIAGSGFTGATAVTFGGAAATSLTVDSDTSLTAVSPAGTGTVDVSVTTPGGTSATSTSSRFAYTQPPAAQAPTVTGVSPNSGPTAGGTTVTIAGTDFVAGATVTFGGTAAANVVVVSPTTITATTPARTAGAVAVRVTNPDGLFGNLASGYTYRNAPTIASISPTSGTTAGNTQVTITGTNFVGSGGTTVTFDGIAGTSISVSSATRLTVRTPAHAAGVVAVVVTTAGGSSAYGQFTYVPPPAITDLSPNAGPVTGGTSVTITGSAFTGATQVRFGSTDATYTITSDTTITAAAPARSAGVVNVTVTTPYGSANTPNAERYTYVASPTVTGLSPASGPATGGTQVRITGTNFSFVTAVTFGGVNATSFTVNSTTRITATAPAQAAGVVAVRVTTAGGTSAETTAARYTYTASGNAAPTVAARQSAADLIAGRRRALPDESTA